MVGCFLRGFYFCAMTIKNFFCDANPVEALQNAKIKTGKKIFIVYDL